jgi:hypothetical protein
MAARFSAGSREWITSVEWLKNDNLKSFSNRDKKRGKSPDVVNDLQKRRISLDQEERMV